VGNLREGDLLEDPDIDGMIILRWIFVVVVPCISINIKVFDQQMHTLLT
jgi:hypothetical protein